MAEKQAADVDETRRATLDVWSRWGLGVALVAAYGTFASFLGRFLFPSAPPPRGWMFVSPLSRLKVGQGLLYRTPGGATVNIARQRSDETAEAFIALSSTCPHLGCQVHWEGAKNRFFCPCHNGVFSPDGVGIGGPPGDAGQDLPRYALKVDDGLLYIEVSTEEVALGPGKILDEQAAPPGPGHDPCLYHSSGQQCPIDAGVAGGPGAATGRA